MGYSCWFWSVLVLSGRSVFQRTFLWWNDPGKYDGVNVFGSSKAGWSWKRYCWCHGCVRLPEAVFMASDVEFGGDYAHQTLLHFGIRRNKRWKTAKHVFARKTPLFTNLSQIRKLVYLAKTKKGLVFCVYSKSSALMAIFCVLKALNRKAEESWVSWSILILAFDRFRPSQARWRKNLGWERGFFWDLGPHY